MKNNMSGLKGIQNFVGKVANPVKKVVNGTVDNKKTEKMARSIYAKAIKEYIKEQPPKTETFEELFGKFDELV